MHFGSDMTTFAHAAFPYLARLYEPLKWGFWGILGIFVLDGIADPLIAALINQDQTWTWDPVILSFLLEWMPAFAGAGAALLATWGLSWWAHRHETGRSAFRTAKPARLLSSPNEIAFAKAFQKEGSEAGASEEARSKLRPRENEYVPLPLLPYDTAKRNGARVPPETGDATGGPASHLPASLNGAGLADSAGVSDGAGLGDADLADLIGKDQNVLLI